MLLGPQVGRPCQGVQQHRAGHACAIHCSWWESVHLSCMMSCTYGCRHAGGHCRMSMHCFWHHSRNFGRWWLCKPGECHLLSPQHTGCGNRRLVQPDKVLSSGSTSSNNCKIGSCSTSHHKATQASLQWQMCNSIWRRHLHARVYVVLC